MEEEAAGTQTEESLVLALDEEYEHPMAKLPWYLQWMYKLKRVVFLTFLFVPCACMCMGAWVRGCVGAWVHGCMGAWVHGCVGAWVHGCVGV